jgi:hypothetical protein
MKKIISALIFLVLLAIAGCFIYFNSENYKYELARNERTKSLNGLNNIHRLYIYEGVYSFESYATSTKTFKDKFGEQITTSRKDYFGTGEVSFKSDKIVIVLKKSKEEIIIGEPYIPVWALSEDFTAYYFPIVRWRTYINNTCVFKYDSTGNHKYIEELRSEGDRCMVPTLILNIYKSKTDGKGVTAGIDIAAMNFYKGFKLDLAGLNAESFNSNKPIENLFKDPWDFKFIPDKMIGTIEMNNLKYKYDSFYGIPKYVNASYESEEYDIERYLSGLKRRHIRNPFVLNHRWK